jgi:hypothetical protein
VTGDFFEQRLAVSQREARPNLKAADEGAGFFDQSKRFFRRIDVERDKNRIR